MASTNHTPNYELSQFLPKNLPTWLGDYNSDMSKIDTAMAINHSSAESALVTANAADSTATASAAKVAQLEKELDALKGIIAEGNEKLGMHSIRFSNIATGIKTLLGRTNNNAEIFYITLRGTFDIVANAWNGKSGCFIADIPNPEDVAALSKSSTLLFFSGAPQTAEQGQTISHFGIQIKSKPDGVLGLFISPYHPTPTGSYGACFSSTVYSLSNNIFPDVSTPTIVNFNDTIDTINVDQTNNLNVAKVNGDV